MHRYVFIILILIIVFPFSSYATHPNEILKLIDLRYEIIKQKEFKLEYQVGLWHKKQQKDELFILWATETVKTRMLINQFFTSVGVTDSLTCYLELPYIYIQQETSTSQKRKNTDLGDISAGINYKNDYQSGFYMVDITYTAPSGYSPYKIDFYNDMPTGSGFHTLRPEGTLVAFIDEAVIYGSVNLEYGFSANDLAQRRIGPNGETVLNEVTPGIVIGFKAGTAINFSDSFSADFGIELKQYDNNEYKWNFGSKSKGDSYKTVYFYTSASVTINTYSFYPKFNIGLTDDSYDAGISFRFPLF